MKYVVHQASRRGGRSVNEDRVAYAYTSEALFMVVADGMGGHDHGQVASEMLVQTMTSLFQARAQPLLPNPQGFLLDGIYAAHDAINEYALRKGLLDPPHTTCVAAVVQEEIACWAHVGDSRLYHFDKHRLLARTRDHSAAQQLVEQGLLDEDQISLHPDRNKLYNSVGGFLPPEIELSEPVKLKAGDVLMLCSDGVWSQMKAQEMAFILRAYPLDQAIEHLMNYAEFHGGGNCDNLSVVAMRYGEEKFDDEQVIRDDLGLDDLIIKLKQLSQRKTGKPSSREIDIDKAIAEIDSVLAKYGLDKETP